jgi:hypothetical protein
MRRVLRLDPVPALTGCIATIAALRDNAFKTHPAGCAADLTLLVLGDEDAVDSALEQPSEVSLAQRQR